MSLDEVLFEFYRIGNAVKVSAIDPKTGTEISIVGAASMPESALRALAVRKLHYVLEKNAKGGGA